MKKIIFLALTVSLFFAFSKTALYEAVTVGNSENAAEYVGVKSATDLEKAYESGIYPMNLLTKEAITSFKESLIFDEHQNLRGAHVKEVQEELTEEQYILFLEAVTQSNVILDGNTIERLANPFPTSSRICSHRFPTLCTISSCETACNRCCGSFALFKICIAPCGSSSSDF